MSRLLPLFRVWLLSLGLVAPVLVQAAEVAVPAALEPWRDWVLHGQEEQTCPFLYRQSEQRFCAWPGLLTLEVEGDSARFRQEWELFAESEIQLPGDGRSWPQGVRDGRRAVEVTEREGRPVVRLQSGGHVLSGTLEWARRPEYIQLPERTARLRLHVDGQEVGRPQADARGRLWLGKRGSRAADTRKVRDSHTVRVFRRLEDAIPRLLETRIQLQVSGNERELRLGRALLEDFVPQRLDSPLPARVEPDGSLRVQVRPGQWQITLLARQASSDEVFGPQETYGGWPSQEVWSFSAQRHLRSVEVSGAPGIDPQQTGMPEEWKNFPAYLLEGEDRLQLTEVQRGDADPAPDVISLKRRLILDFDGSGYTVEDHLQGQLNRDRRLQMQGAFQLGRAELNGQPQLITRLREGETAGLELRQGPLNLVAISRVPRAGAVSAAGWNTDFRSAQAQLQVPPGWEVFSVQGADRAHPTWISRWSLWDIFLVLIIAASFARLYGPRIGMLAFAAVVVAYHEPDAPLFIWLNLAAVLALLRLVPESRVRSALVFYRNASVLVLMLIAIPWAVDEVRKGLYPQLEQPWQVIGAGRMQADATSAEPAAPEESAMSEAPSAVRKMDRLQSLVPGGRGAAAYEMADRVSDPTRGYDAGALIQTGPGLPEWEWRQVRITWNGPLQAGETLEVHLLPPPVVRGLRFVSVLLFTLLGLMLVLREYRHGGRWTLADAGPVGTAAVVCLVLTAGGWLPGVTSEARADPFPPPAYLDELRKRLLEPPACLPACAEVPQMAVRVSAGTLRLELQLHAVRQTAVPLPHDRHGWQPSRWTLESAELRETPAVLRDAQQVPHVLVPAGVHVLVMEGPLAGLDSVSLEFALRPRRVTWEGEGWQVSGVSDGLLQAGSLTLHRIQPRIEQEEQTPELLPDPEPPFLRVDRTLVLGDEWRLHTRVQRVAPAQGPVHATVPLWPGERVTSPGVVAHDQAVRVSLGARQRAMAWTSMVEPVAELALRAGTDRPWVERWRVQADTRWHVEHEGLAPVLEDGVRHPGTTSWQPWPGEGLTLKIRRPAPVQGSTLTVERVLLHHTPGQRSSETRMTVHLRSSQGGDYEFRLPDAARLQSLTVNGAVQILPQQRDRVRIPLHPGTVNAEVIWQAPGEPALVTRTPMLDLGRPAANVSLILNMPADRWLLVTGGPQIGPAVLFWGLLIVVVLVALGLGRIGGTPLRTWHWILLGAAMLATETLPGALLVVGWFHLLARRRNLSRDLRPEYFNLTQIGLALLSLLALGVLLGSIPAGLLSQPDMQIVGNGSSGNVLRWYQDFSAALLPEGWVLSVPMWVYRLTMLAWSLWLATALLAWLRWAWTCFSAQGLWRRRLKAASADGATHVSVEAVEPKPEAEGPPKGQATDPEDGDGPGGSQPRRD